jgi:hypothetical protein
MDPALYGTRILNLDYSPKSRNGHRKKENVIQPSDNELKYFVPQKIVTNLSEIWVWDT